MIRYTLALFLILPAAGLALLHAETKTERQTSQILGGQLVQEGEFRHVMVIGVQGLGERAGFARLCTASLIDPQWVLTAAHCVTDDDGTTVAAYRIWLNLDHYSDFAIISNVGQVIVHPEYRSPAGSVDLALVEIPGGFEEFSFDVEPVKIADISQETNAYLKGTLATAVGTGEVSGLGHGNLPSKVEIPWWTAQDCIRDRQIVVPASVHDRALCAGYGENAGSKAAGPASGDSGSPLLLPTSQGSYVQIGVASRTTVGRAGGVDWVPVYMRLTSFRDWIYSYIGEDEPDPPDAPRVSHILTHVFAGQLPNSTAKTEITITNRSRQPCSATVRFHQGTAEAPRVRFNDRASDNNTLDISIPAGRHLYQHPHPHGPQARAEKITLTRDAGQALAVGAVYIQNSPDCAADALHVEGRYLITRSDGEIMEAFSILPQAPADWLSDRDCRLLAVDFGPDSNVGLAMVTAEPGRPAPVENPPRQPRLTFQVLDWQGNHLDEFSDLDITGKQHALNPWSFTEPRLIRVCLEAPGDNRFRLSLIAIASSSSPHNVQYSAQALIPLHD